MVGRSDIIFGRPGGSSGKLRAYIFNDKQEAEKTNWKGCETLKTFPK